jgi:hypothetical protein
VRAVATPGSRVATSEAERPFSGRSLMLVEFTTPLTVEDPTCALPVAGTFPTCITRFTTAFRSALIVMVVCVSARPCLEAVIS